MLHPDITVSTDDMINIQHVGWNMNYARSEMDVLEDVSILQITKDDMVTISRIPAPPTTIKIRITGKWVKTGCDSVIYDSLPVQKLCMISNKFECGRPIWRH